MDVSACAAVFGRVRVCVGTHLCTTGVCVPKGNAEHAHVCNVSCVCVCIQVMCSKHNKVIINSVCVYNDACAHMCITVYVLNTAAYV